MSRFIDPALHPMVLARSDPYRGEPYGKEARMIIKSSTHDWMETVRKPGRDDPDPRPSAPPPPDLPDRADPPEPINFPSPPDADECVSQRQPIAHPSDVLRAIALLEEQAVQLRHFTVLDTILRLKRRFNARPPIGAA